MSQPEPDDLRVVDNPDARRYEAWLGERLAGYSEYRANEGHITFLHTEIEPDLGGRGLGSRLVAAELADARRRGLRVSSKCPFVSAYLRRHPEAAE